VKKFVAVLLGALVVGSLSMAADQENSAKETKDTSTNVLTGTKKTKVKHKKTVKGAHGEKMDATVTETTKEHKDGQVEKSVKVDADSQTADKDKK
jgi:hypothetical protein